jgi:hypothetical protein
MFSWKHIPFKYKFKWLIAIPHKYDVPRNVCYQSNLSYYMNNSEVLMDPDIWGQPLRGPDVAWIKFHL